MTLSVNGQEPEFTVAAIFFGIGAALVLDEYALILHLSDVYWEEDGRTSVDAVFAAVAVAGLLVMGLHPLMFFLPVWHGADAMALRAGVVCTMVLTLPLAVVVLLKGKVWTGLIGMFIVLLLVVGAIRLSRPHAPWARWRYTTRPDKMRRALQRERTWRRPVVRAKLWLQCAIAGTPRLPDERIVDAELDREVHPAPPPERNRADPDRRLVLGFLGAVFLRHRVHRGRPHHRADLDRGGRRGRPRVLRRVNRIRSRASRQLGARQRAAQAAAAGLAAVALAQPDPAGPGEVLRLVDGTEPIELWAWVGAYDHVALCQLWGPMTALPPPIPRFTRELRQLWEDRGRPRMPPRPRDAHDALVDARDQLRRFRLITSTVERSP